MDVTSASSLNAMALKANNAVDATLLKKALDVQASSAMQLLQTIPTPPQAEGKGIIVDAQA
jgi:hypothetical protein